MFVGETIYAQERATRSAQLGLDASNQHLRLLAKQVLDGDADGMLRSARAALYGVRESALDAAPSADAAAKVDHGS